MPRKRKATSQKVKGEDGDAEMVAPAAAQASATATPPRKARGASKASSPRHPFTALALGQTQRLIEPGPILLVSTGDVADGSHNLMTLGFHMMVQHSGPTLIGICLGPWDASFAALRAQGQCVLAVPDAALAETVVAIGNCSKDDDDDDTHGGGGGAAATAANKWTRFGLPPLPAAVVTPPLVGGPHILGNIECVVHDRRLVGRYALWVLKAVRSWWVPDRVQRTGRMLHHRGNGVFAVSGETVVDLHEGMTKWAELAEDEEDEEEVEEEVEEEEEEEDEA
ncbi:FMN-binding split barrel [Niveomyces insectorum RCEF 264]|uniref:FMN-binding split barrel n=1 Tax=Niveomyces insectorum RCEF 264 TaxID=1081102 RepID=A0A162MDY8_9HYPO|nr:FMN-binding split barrel [Niveomyces insectorum RCEF 264]